MPIHYNVRAEVVDIRTDTPRPDDVFLVDTNVWYWLTYTRASLGTDRPLRYQVTEYPSYILKVRQAGARLYRFGLSLAELAHLIEKVERDIYTHSNGPVSPKEFRHNYPSERANVVGEIQAAWSQVEALSSPLNFAIDDTTTRSGLARLSGAAMDGHDLFMLEAALARKVLQVITDDGDYITVHGIRVFTANANAIQAAQQQGKLVHR